jgi:hypothetical protein
MFWLGWLRGALSGWVIWGMCLVRVLRIERLEMRSIAERRK